MQCFESAVRRRDSFPPTHPPTTRSTPFHITQSFSSLGQRHMALVRCCSVGKKASGNCRIYSSAV
jgi:hypothetical protein